MNNKLNENIKMKCFFPASLGQKQGCALHTGGSVLHTRKYGILYAFTEEKLLC